MTDGPVRTAVAAQELGMKPHAFLRWARRHNVTPEVITAGGHFRWNLDDLTSRHAEIHASRKA